MFLKIYLCFLLILMGEGVCLAQDQQTGVVILHGKNGTPNSYIAPLVEFLRSKGYKVSAPSMPWAKGRIYDASYDDCLKIIHSEIYLLRKKGVQNIILIGQSLGANVALGYAAVHPEDLSGLVLLAPGHYPEISKNKLSDDIARAQALLKNGKSDVASFADVNQGKTFEVNATPENYLSFCDPDGPANMKSHVDGFKVGVPVLVVSEGEPRIDPKGYIFDRLPSDPRDQFIRSNADHLEVPQAATQDVLKWLEKIQPSAATKATKD